jgi:hypothetical protein
VLMRRQILSVAIVALGSLCLQATAEEKKPEDSALTANDFAMSAPKSECEDPLTVLYKLPNFLLQGEEWRETSLTLRLAVKEFLFKHAPDGRSNSDEDKVIADGENREILQAIVSNRIPEAVRQNFSKWEPLFQSILMHSSMVYRHEELGLKDRPLAEVMKRELPSSQSGLLVESSQKKPPSETKEGGKKKSWFAGWLGLGESSEGVINRAKALEGYRYISAPNLYKVLFRFDERIRLDLLKDLVNNSEASFPPITHMEAYIILGAFPIAQQTLAWDILGPLVITRADMFPARLLVQATAFLGPEAFLKSLASNQGELTLDEVLALLKEVRGKTPISVKEIAAGSNFPHVPQEEAFALIEKYRPLDFESAYAIAWAYIVRDRDPEEISHFLTVLEAAAASPMTEDQSQLVRTKIAEKMWPVGPASGPSENLSLLGKIKIAKSLKVGLSFILSRLYWELQVISDLKVDEFMEIVEIIPIAPHRTTYDGVKNSAGKPLGHEIIFADNLFSELALELRFKGSPAIKWYYSDLYWMGITTNLVVMNMLLQMGPAKGLPPEHVATIRQKISKLFAEVKPLTPEIVDPKKKWNIPWEVGHNSKLYSFNPSEPNELAPARRGVTVERVIEYFERLVSKLERP